jgi:hypothetical protein
LRGPGFARRPHALHLDSEKPDLRSGNLHVVPAIELTSVSVHREDYATLPNRFTTANPLSKPLTLAAAKGHFDGASVSVVLGSGADRDPLSIVKIEIPVRR